MKRNWKHYQHVTANAPPSPLLREALPFVRGTRALDLGAGALRDSRYLLAQGFEVVALDHVMPPRLPRDRRFIFIKDRFEEVLPSREQFSLINAQWSLPFAGSDKARFRRLWRDLMAALSKGGVFTGQLFGVRDAWAGQKRHGDIAFHTRKEIVNLLKGMDVLHFGEVERLGREIGRDKLKHWHYFNIIARKR